jgi:hypothetical protein
MKTSNQPSRRDVKPDASAPWWRFGHVWLVIAGPAVVVVASFVTVSYTHLRAHETG